MTGNMLFEILDPFLMWKQIFCSLSVTIDDDAVQSEEVSFSLVRCAALELTSIRSQSRSFDSSYGCLGFMTKRFRNSTRPSSLSAFLIELRYVDQSCA